MRTLRALIAVPLVLLLAFALPASADDQHVTGQSAIDDAIADHVASQDADRSAIHEALSRPEVQSIAGKAGIDLDRIASSSRTLQGPELQRAASAARGVNYALAAGGSSITLSTTTVIIILLLVLLIIVAVK